MHRYLYAYANPLVYVDLGGNEAVDIANGFASSALNLMFGGEVSPKYIKTFDPEYANVIRESTGTFDRIYNNKYDKKFKVDFRDWSITKSYEQAAPLGEKLKSVATLGIPALGESIGRTAGAISVSTDESYSDEIRNKADFDIGTQGPDVVVAIAARKGRLGAKKNLGTVESNNLKGSGVAEVDEAAKSRIRNRIDAMKENMTEGEKGRTTYGAAEVELSDGTRQVWVSAAGKKGYVPPRIRGDDKVVQNKVENATRENRLNDAEQTLMREADEAGAQIKAMGATRDMCAACQAAAQESKVLDTVATPLKQVKTTNEEKQ